MTHADRLREEAKFIDETVRLHRRGWPESTLARFEQIAASLRAAAAAFEKLGDAQKAAFDALEEALNLERTERVDDMPTEKDAINAMFRAYLRLKELGWKEAIYCPKDGTRFRAIEAGSTGIAPCHYMGEWPNGFCFAE